MISSGLVDADDVKFGSQIQAADKLWQRRDLVFEPLSLEQDRYYRLSVHHIWTRMDMIVVFEKLAPRS